MGTGSSKTQEKQLKKSVDAVWSRVEASCKEVGGMEKNDSRLTLQKRRGWKTVRIFVSSTFKDFNPEREVLVKEVFPDLRAYCEKGRIHLVDCDLRWGIPASIVETQKDFVLKSCLSEIDRCYEDNQWPFFINMTGARAGWVPTEDAVPSNIREDYKWIDGLSVTEMEIMHAAYRADNPNSIFMIRNSSFLADLPQVHHQHFVEKEKLLEIKVETLKQRLHEHFPADRVFEYDVEFDKVDKDNKILFKNLRQFTDIVFNFFKKRIEEQYPFKDTAAINEDPMQVVRETHEAFKTGRCENVQGRDDVIEAITRYIVCGDDTGSYPLLLLGEAGMGKTSVMAKCVQIALDNANDIALPDLTRPRSVGRKPKKINGWHVFYHFVGCAPGSTDLNPMLKRLLTELCDLHGMAVPRDACPSNAVCAMLSNPAIPPVLIFIDAINQFQSASATACDIMPWLPSHLSKQVRCVFSMITNSKPHKTLGTKFPKAKHIKLAPLDRVAKEKLVTKNLAQYGKGLDGAQMQKLLSKLSSDNPLWLSIACEEMRIHGDYRTLTAKIECFPDLLADLEIQVLKRLEQEESGQLIRATVCLLEASVTGLLESELRFLLADESTLYPPNSEKLMKTNFSTLKFHETGILPAYKWSGVYRSLKPFLRPFGDSGEGRLDFYHRSLSKAVRQLYFAEKIEKTGTKTKTPLSEATYKWWQKKLSDFFMHHTTPISLERKLEELPTHLLAWDAKEDLAKFLSNWDVLVSLYDERYSYKLITLWRSCADIKEMFATYIDMLQNTQCCLKPDPDKLKTLADRYYKVAILSLQCNEYDTGAELYQYLYDLEIDLGERPENMCEMYWLLSCIHEEALRGQTAIVATEIPRRETIITACKEALAIREPFVTQSMYHKQRHAMALNRLGYNYCRYIDLDKAFPGKAKADLVKEAEKQCLKSVDRAINLFSEIGDMGSAGYSTVTKAYAAKMPQLAKQIRESQITLLLEAERLILEHCGDLHFYLCAIYERLVLHYLQTDKQQDNAYQYLLKWYGLCDNLFGLTSPLSQTCINYMNAQWAQARAGKVSYSASKRRMVS